jgi:hypothetical protein
VIPDTSSRTASSSANCFSSAEHIPKSRLLIDNFQMPLYFFLFHIAFHSMGHKLIAMRKVQQNGDRGCYSMGLPKNEKSVRKNRHHQLMNVEKGLPSLSAQLH